MRLLVYAEAGNEVGLGHVRRCEALVHACKEQGWQCDAFSEGSDAAAYDAMVIDSYVISAQAVRIFGAKCPYLIGFHDFGEPNTDFSLLISTVYQGSLMQGTTRILGGHQYRFIHPDIMAVHRPRIAKAISSAVVSLGGSDDMADFARTTAATLAKHFPEIHFQPVAGMPGQEAARIFSSADIAVSGGGQTMNELLYLGVPTIVIELSPDQAGQIAEAAAQGAVRVAGTLSDPSLSEKIAENIRSLYSKTARLALHGAGRAFVDGKGAGRVVAAIEEHFHAIL